MHSGRFLSYSRKKKKLAKTPLSFVVTRCHSLSFVVTRCHLLSIVVSRCITRCHSLCHSSSFVVIHSHSLYHSLSLDVSLVCLFINNPCKGNILSTTPKNSGNQEHIITQLLDNITFLRDLLRQKDKVID